jgi:hypothetical protein
MIVSPHEYQPEREAFSQDGLSGEAYVARLSNGHDLIWRFLCRAPTSFLEKRMSELAVKQIVLASRPKGLPTRENFRLEEVPMPELPQGGLLLRVLYLSLDSYMRGRMDDRKSYAKS